MELNLKEYKWHLKENMAEEGAGVLEESAGIMNHFFWHLSFVIIVEAETFQFSYCNQFLTKGTGNCINDRGSKWINGWKKWKGTFLLLLNSIVIFWSWIEYTCRSFWSLYENILMVVIWVLASLIICISCDSLFQFALSYV